MIRWMTVWALVIRYVRIYKRDVNLVLMALYWPLLDIIMWGCLGLWVQQNQAPSNDYITMTLLGLLLWQIIGRGCNIMIMAFLEEIWSHNVVNLFSLPVQLREWILGVLLFFTIMISITSLFSIAVMVLLYKISFSYLLFAFVLFFVPLFFSAVWIGLSALSSIIVFGKRGMEIGFIIIWFLLPFSGALYPVEVLPAWGQTLSVCFPMYYIFKAMRAYVLHQDSTTYFIQGLCLSILYAACAVILFVWCFNHSKQKGLARLTD